MSPTQELEPAAIEPLERERPRLLFCARRPPFPLVTGARIRSHRLLSGLAESFETTFVTFEHEPGSPDGHVGRAELERLLPGIGIVTVPGRGRGKRVEQTRSLLWRRSWEYGRYRLAAMRETLERLAELGPHVIHFDDLGVAQFGPLDGALNVYSAHNVEYRILEGTVRNSRGPRRQFARLERRKVEPLERRVWRTMSLCLACSDLDAAELRSGGARVVVCPNGADPVEPLPPASRGFDEPLRLLFVGAVDYRPNQLGLEWFIREVLPRLREQVPVEVDVVGAPPRKLAGADAVVMHGRVPSVQPYYERAHAVIVPVLFGSGTRLKVIEAMAYRRPVVATVAGAEGLPIRSDCDYFQADEPKAFADALERIARQIERSDPQLEQMLDEARKAIEPLLWPRIVSELRSTYLESAAALA
ncbi:MAG TPA: glycosyltransferase family 4 protein [Solirubrobacteraceae bacterium]|nr:glycosyltransferase family 4 protein [Solirubrobacteraceae bacterium]